MSIAFYFDEHVPRAVAHGLRLRGIDVGLTVNQARQMFSKYNCHVKSAKADLNLSFDQSNSINIFANEWLKPLIETSGWPSLDLRQVASINGLLFEGKTTIKSAPYSVGDASD